MICIPFLPYFHKIGVILITSCITAGLAGFATYFFDRRKNKIDRLSALKTEIINICQKLIINGINHEYRALYESYLEANIYIKPPDEYIELDKQIFLLNYQFIEKVGNDFYLLKADLMKCKHELSLLWENEHKKKELYKLIDIVLISNTNMYRGKYIVKEWQPSERNLLKSSYREDTENVQDNFLKSELGKSICDILKNLSPDILSHIKDALEKIKQENIKGIRV